MYLEIQIQLQWQKNNHNASMQTLKHSIFEDSGHLKKASMNLRTHHYLLFYEGTWETLHLLFSQVLFKSNIWKKK